MSTYEKVNDDVRRARGNHSDRGYEFFVLMDPETFYRYMETTPPHGARQAGMWPTVQGCRIIRTDVEGYVVCRGV